LNKNIREIFIGMLLGDGHILRSGQNKAYIAFEPSSKKTDYLNYVKDILNKEGMELSDNQTYVHDDVRYGVQNSSVRFSTKALEELKPLADLFLDDEGRKKISSDISVNNSNTDVEKEQNKIENTSDYSDIGSDLGVD
jgi:hypothetical protein